MNDFKTNLVEFISENKLLLLVVGLLVLIIALTILYRKLRCNPHVQRHYENLVSMVTRDNKKGTDIYGKPLDATDAVEQFARGEKNTFLYVNKEGLKGIIAESVKSDRPFGLLVFSKTCFFCTLAFPNYKAAGQSGNANLMLVAIEGNELQAMAADDQVNQIVGAVQGFPEALIIKPKQSSGNGLNVTVYTSSRSVQDYENMK